jgi:hypothetical protein
MKVSITLIKVMYTTITLTFMGDAMSLKMRTQKA